MSQSSVGFEAGPDSISDAGRVETVPTVHQLHPGFCHLGITWRLQELVQLFLSTPTGGLKANDAGVSVWCLGRLHGPGLRTSATSAISAISALPRRRRLGLEARHGVLEVPGQGDLDDVLRCAGLLR